MNSNKAIIFSDGSSRGNPGKGGFGAIVVCGEKVIEIGGKIEKTTNNRMEMKGSIEGIKVAAKEGVEEIIIYTDSSYLLNGASKWIFSWQLNNWKTKDGKEVLNKDLWEEIGELLKKTKIVWKLIAGHAGIPANERCDEIATGFADGEKISLYEGSFSKYSVDTTKVVSSPDSQIEKKNKAGKAYSYISKVDGEVRLHKTWNDCEARVKGKSSARFRKSLSKSDEEKIVAEFSKK